MTTEYNLHNLGLNPGQGKNCYKGYYCDKWQNLDMNCIFDNSTSKLCVLCLLIDLWL